MSKRHTNFLLVALVSVLSLFMMFSCKGAKPSNDPATEDPTENPDPAVDPSEPEDQGLPEGLSGEFSISENKKVRFTRGNLYCTIADGNPTWNIEANQYDFRTWSGKASVIDGTSSNTGTPTNNVGLLCWSKDIAQTYPEEYNDNQSKTTSDTFAIAKASGHDCVIAGYDVLTSAEWIYLLNTRSSASSKYGLATITTPQGAQVTGRIFLPDDWNIPDNLNFKSEAEKEDGTNYDFSTNTYSNEDWIKMEGAGAVFLPNAGTRTGITLTEQSSSGYYWSSTCSDISENMAYVLNIGQDAVAVHNVFCYKGNSVRLVKKVE